MTHARRRLQRFARLAAVGGLLCGGLMITDAVAGEGSTPRGGPGSTSENNGLGARLVSELGMSRTAGSWIGDDGRQVVAVTDADAAAEVERAGARAKVVRHSMNRLRSATDTLSEAPVCPAPHGPWTTRPTRLWCRPTAPSRPPTGPACPASPRTSAASYKCSAPQAPSPPGSTAPSRSLPPTAGAPRAST